MSAQAAPSATSIAFGIRVADPRGWRHWVERRSAKRADRIVCVSESVRTFCETAAGFSAKKLCVIPNGIELNDSPPLFQDSEQWEAEPATLRDGRCMILCVGRLHHQKGYDWLLPQWKRWSDAFPNHDLVIAGDGPDRASLAAQARELQISERVIFLGQRKDVSRLLAKCDMLLLPSRWEGMPNALLEAMAAGRPVVASHAEGVLEVLGEDLAKAQTAPLGDADMWAAKVTRILEDREFAGELGRSNRTRVESEFQTTQMVERYAAMFEALLAERRHGR
jgi:starch synthase (maltosyl-transferring)